MSYSIFSSLRASKRVNACNSRVKTRGITLPLYDSVKDQFSFFCKKLKKNDVSSDDTF